MFEDAAQHFMHCFQNGRYQFQAAYARALCQEKLGQNIVFPEGWQLSNRELPGAIYVASNLTCYLVAEGHRAALTKEGSDGGQSEVTAAILGNTYRIDVTASWGSFSSYPWRILPNGDFLKILDRHANQNPTRGDRYVIDLIRRTSSLPMTALPAHGLPRTIGSQQLAKTEQKPEELTFAEKIKQLKSELREDARVDASREAATKHPKAAEWGERVVGVIAVIVVIAICLGAIGFLVWWIQWLSK
jgi:hypothetical protein